MVCEEFVPEPEGAAIGVALCMDVEVVEVGVLDMVDEVGVLETVDEVAFMVFVPCLSCD